MNNFFLFIYIGTSLLVRSGLTELGITNSYFFNGVCETRFLFVLFVQSRCFIHGVHESKLICACAAFAHAVCKTATWRTQNKHEKSSFAHSVKKNYFSTTPFQGEVFIPITHIKQVKIIKESFYETRWRHLR